MARVSFDDGRWFDTSKARSWKESTHHDGRNFISDATGSQWEHEHLYLTAKSKAWILNQWSDWQGSRETYREISASEAAAWLVRNGHENTPAELVKATEALEA